ncbi:MAG: hypothetical protein CMO49_01290 [Verrucomicrobiales bacterium]|nr:hypothetical protein [Verrucomicrobiales bacterium]|tara:strand:- start:19028 stop:19690 length:663 start_codon:yes stop_codon:yes gene_type:complete
MKLQYPEFAENPEIRCPVVLLLDVSASMEGAPIQALNAGLASFKYDIEEDEMASLRVEVGVVTFGEEVKIIHDFSTIDHFTPPQLTTKGKTPFGEAINLGLDMLEFRKKVFRDHGIQYYRPWVFLITDGAPTDDEWPEAAKRVHEMEANNKCSFFTIAVEGADLETLEEIAPKKRPPLKLQDLKFEELFKWMSASVRRVSKHKSAGEMAMLPSVSTWAVR